MAGSQALERIGADTHGLHHHPSRIVIANSMSNAQVYKCKTGEVSQPITVIGAQPGKLSPPEVIGMITNSNAV